MMKFIIRQIGPFKGEAWVEDGPHVVCTAKLVLVPGGGPGNLESILIDQIDTPHSFRRKGYARYLVGKLVEVMGKENVSPTTIDPNPSAIAFWKSMGMEPALGWEEDE